MWRRPRLVTADTRRPGPRPGTISPAAWSLRTGAGGNAGDGSGPWADNATVERREAASRLRGRAHASQAWRRALPARLIQGWRLSALRHPLAGVATRRRIPGAPQAPRERRELRFEKNCGSKEFEEWWRGTSGTGLFDIVNRGSATLPETSVLGPAQHWQLVPAASCSLSLLFTGKTGTGYRGADRSRGSGTGTWL